MGRSYTTRQIEIVEKCLLELLRATRGRRSVRVLRLERILKVLILQSSCETLTSPRKYHRQAHYNKKASAWQTVRDSNNCARTYMTFFGWTPAAFYSMADMVRKVIPGRDRATWGPDMKGRRPRFDHIDLTAIALYYYSS